MGGIDCYGSPIQLSNHFGGAEGMEVVPDGNLKTFVGRIVALTDANRYRALVADKTRISRDVVELEQDRLVGVQVSVVQAETASCPVINVNLIVGVVRSRVGGVETIHKNIM